MNKLTEKKNKIKKNITITTTNTQTHIQSQAGNSL